MVILDIWMQSRVPIAETFRWQIENIVESAIDMHVSLQWQIAQYMSCLLERPLMY